MVTSSAKIVPVYIFFTDVYASFSIPHVYLEQMGVLIK